jgi:D-alanyl-D-alanine carboxypeptidase/D-alanyl-D-alanine-endopeptidase (penicillin-binding protein 4)
LRRSARDQRAGRRARLRRRFRARHVAERGRLIHRASHGGARRIATPRARCRRAALVGALALACALGAASPSGAASSVVEPGDGGATWTAADRAALGRDLDQLFAAHALLGAHAGLFVADARDRAPLYARLADDDFVPASTLKLVVGSAALSRLGGAFRFRTTALVERDATGPDRVARVVLRGGGDPFLNVADLNGAAAAVAAAGVRTVAATPGVVTDSMQFDDERYPPGWVWDDFPYDYAAPVTATSFQENAVHLTVTGGARAGAPAVVDTGLGTVRTGDPAACDPAAPLPVVVEAMTTASAVASTIDATRTAEGCIAVTGGVPAGGSDDVDAAVPHPELLAGSVLLAGLRAHGIGISGYGVGNAGPAAQAVWTHESEPMTALLARMWLPSDNLLAELLLKSLGVLQAGTPGTTANGALLESQYLASLGIDPATISLRDGSGLSIYDRITPRALVELLDADWAGPNRAVVLTALPVAGMRGTLKGSFTGTLAAGRVFAKSGSMTHVRALAGYVATQKHGTIAFALMVDDYVGDTAPLDTARAAIVARLTSS